MSQTPNVGTATRTVGDLWRQAVAREAGVPAFLYEKDGRWEEVGWAEAGARVRALSAGFLSLGVRRGDRVAILSRTRIDWTLCDYALSSIGAVVIPMYQTNSREECAYLLADSGALALLCENAEQLEKTDALAGEIAGLKHVIAFEDADGAMPLAELEAAGGALLAETPAALTKAEAAVSPDDVLTYIYTSGTTGPPKGCVISHANFVAEIEAIEQVEDLFAPGDRIVLFLPLAHNFARLVQYCGAAVGFTIAFCPDFNDVARALEAVRPTILPSVPRFFEKAHAAAITALGEARPVRKRVTDWALRVGRRTAGLRAARQKLSPSLRLQAELADRLVFSQIRRRLSPELRFAVSGGAPLSPEILEFFAACGILILEGYGLSETTSGCTTNRPHAYRFGTVGLPLPGVEIQLADDGEVLIRGPTVFQGYAGRAAETGEILSDDGWLRSGDIGRIDDDGFVTITDRKKELIVTAGGKKISPQNLENALIASGYVSQALVCGDRRPYVVALIHPDYEKVGKTAGTDEEVRALMARVVADVNEELGRTEQIKRFAILPREFSMDHGEITPTLKLRRRVCEQHFRDEIEQIYAATRE